ncbi:MAG: hypothetical protein SVS85_04000, partial [Candidatus Nanohaloarchaea archaeon]|nr:hypothetical protein [Candidatus Nanohaloarchaea archaeon]
EDYTGRDIAQVCKQAAISALFETGDAEDAELSREDFLEAIQDLEEGKMGMETDFLVGEEHPAEIFA